MVREHELAELFRDAAGEPPEATFDERDVVRASRRVTARRRMGAVGGSLAVAAVLVTGVGFGAGWLPGGTTGQSERPRAGVSEQGAPSPRSGGGQGPTALSVPGGSQGCGPPDRRLAGALSEQLPGRSPSGDPVAAEECPPGAEAASFRVRQEGDSGSVTAILRPAAAGMSAGSAEVRHLPDGGLEVTVRADSGKELTLRSSPGGDGSAPYAGELREIARELAGRL